MLRRRRPYQAANSPRKNGAGEGTASPSEALLDALVTRFTEGYTAGVDPLSQALRALK